MDASAWVAIVAAVIALLGGLYTAKSAMAGERQAAEARHQTELQRKIHEDSLQPYVWVDIAPDTAQGALLKLTICNEGPTIATNIHLKFEPSLSDIFDRLEGGEVQRSIDSGISYLAPRRRVQYVLGVGHEFFAKEPTPSITVSVTCEGPNGPCPLNTYEMNLSYLRHSHDYPDGSLHRVAERIKELTAAIKKATTIIDRQD